MSAASNLSRPDLGRKGQKLRLRPPRPAQIPYCRCEGPWPYLDDDKDRVCARCGKTMVR